MFGRPSRKSSVPAQENASPFAKDDIIFTHEAAICFDMLNGGNGRKLVPIAFDVYMASAKEHGLIEKDELTEKDQLTHSGRQLAKACADIPTDSSVIENCVEWRRAISKVFPHMKLNLS